LPKTHVQLIDHAGPWALAKADLGNDATVTVLVSRDRVTSLSGRPETAWAAIAAAPGTAWRPLAGVTSGGASA